jgi:hypothetical protein
VIPSLTACSCDPSCGAIRRVVRNLPKRMTLHRGGAQSERCSASVGLLPQTLCHMPIRQLILGVSDSGCAVLPNADPASHSASVGVNPCGRAKCRYGSQFCKCGCLRYSAVRDVSQPGGSACVYVLPTLRERLILQVSGFCLGCRPRSPSGW